MTQAMTDAEQTSLRILSEVCRVPQERLTPETRLVQDLGVDSVMTLDLLMELEETLGIEIPEVEAAELVSVGDVLAYVRARS